MPPEAKDFRQWLEREGNESGDRLAEELRKRVQTAKPSQAAEPSKRSTADELVELAESVFRFGRTEEGEPFAVEREGPMWTLPFSSLPPKLAKLFRERAKRTPGKQAIGDALTALEGSALDAEPEPTALRVAERDGGVYVDLGDNAGRAVAIRPGNWSVEPRSPALFRRTKLIGELPEPEECGGETNGLLRLREVLNVTEESWPLVVISLVAALRADIAHPILLLDGEQGTGKTTAARYIVGLIDPSSGLIRSQPRDEGAWVTSASSSYAVVLDNVSAIKPWFSDALCKGVTGDALVTRKLYTDNEPNVVTFRRWIILTSIEAGALRGDLAERIVRIELEPIDPTQRRAETELDAAYRKALPEMLGGLYAAVAATLRALPDVKLSGLSRMADFELTAAAVDRACPELTGGNALERYRSQARRLAEDALEYDPFIEGVAEWAFRQEVWEGTASELLQAIGDPDDEPRRKDWPKSGADVGRKLKRFQSVLRSQGIDVRSRRAPGGNRKRLVTIRLLSGKSVPSVPTVPTERFASPAGRTSARRRDDRPGNAFSLPPTKMNDLAWGRR